jgi:Glycosyltransferases involved in cell wall biogenesis
MLVSVIIPVYNVENYIKECVESVVNQDYPEIEIILVDDGSTDTSGFLCDEYEQKYEYVHVIHKNNGGLSDARNTGIKLAKGDYMLFVDSDDYIGKNVISKLVECLEQNGLTDVMFLEAYKVYPDGKEESLGDGYDAQFINGQDKEKVMNHIASLPKFPGSACSKMIKSNLIKKNNIYFEKGLLSEDIDWTIKTVLKADSFAYCDVPYYYYRQNRIGSITNSFSPKTVECLLYIIQKWASQEDRFKYQKQINSFLAYEYVVAILNYNSLKKSGKAETARKLREYKWILKYGRTMKIKMISIAVRLLGIDNGAKIIALFKKRMK